jgi:GAF domain-containing protein
MTTTRPPLEEEGDSGFLVPVLPWQEGPPDAIGVAAWHLALSNLIGQEVPHDLLGLWLFPSRGGVMLLAPEELGGDDLTVDPPHPWLSQHQIFELEERIRRAGYGSVVGIPVRGETRDLGLAIFARLEPARYGPEQAMQLLAMMRQVVPVFTMLSDSPPLAVSTGPSARITRQNVSELVAAAAAEGRTPAEVLRLISGVLHPVIPHERIEVAVAGTGGSWALLSGPPEGRRWSDSTSVVTQHVTGLVARADEDGTIMVGDLRTLGLAWPAYRETRALSRVHAVLGVRLSVAGSETAWLLLGGAAPDLYREPDRELLVSVAPVVAIRVHGLRMALDAEVARTIAAGQQSSQSRAARVASTLAAAPLWSEAVTLFVQDVRESLGYAEVRWALRLESGDCVESHAGDRRPLADLPPLPIGSDLATLLSGAAPFLVSGPRGSDLIVPLRVGGRVVGALELLGGSPGTAGHPVTSAQLFADLIAPHLELLRREASSFKAPVES